MGITTLKFSIWGGISSYIQSEIIIMLYGKQFTTEYPKKARGYLYQHFSHTKLNSNELRGTSIGLIIHKLSPRNGITKTQLYHIKNQVITNILMEMWRGACI